MTLKVVHLVYSFGIGGLERVIVNLINHSASLDVEHHVVTLVDDHGFANQLGNNAVMHCLYKKEGKDLSCHFKLYRLLRKLKADVLHTYNFGTIEYHPVAWFARVPVRVHAEHGRESSYKKIDNPSKYEIFRRLLGPFISYFVVVSYDLQSWAQEKLKFSDKKLKLIYNGISLDEFKPAIDQDTREPLRFVSVGRLVDVKNHTLLIDAFHLAYSKRVLPLSAQLYIVGDGLNMSALKKQAEVLGLSDNVKLLGNRTDIPDILQKSDVFVLSSKYEAMPMTALEAMACKVPVIATKVGGVEYILRDQVNGLLVSPDDAESMADALIKLGLDPALRQTMGCSGRDMVEREYSVSSMTKRYMSLYES